MRQLIYNVFVLDFMYHFTCGESKHTKILKYFVMLCPRLCSCEVVWQIKNIRSPLLQDQWPQHHRVVSYYEGFPPIKPQYSRSSRPEVFYKQSVLRNFAKFTEKHLCQSLFFNKVAGLRPAALLKKRLWHRCIPVNIARFLRTPFLTEHLWWLLLRLLEVL